MYFLLCSLELVAARCCCRCVLVVQLWLRMREVTLPRADHGAVLLALCSVEVSDPANDDELLCVQLHLPPLRSPLQIYM